MKIGLFNVNGASGKIDAIQGFQQQQNIDILFLLETWLPDDTTATSCGNLNLLFNVNRRNTELEIITGGRRNNGGIACLVSPIFRQQINVIERSQDGTFVIVEVQGITFIVTYLAPSLGQSGDDILLSLMDKLENMGTTGTLLLGDFNARLGSVTNDGRTPNRRGMALLNRLLDSSAILQRPTQGNYTTFSTFGRSVTDHIISLNVESHNYVVHESAAIGGSDHRPLTLNLYPDSANPTSRS